MPALIEIPHPEKILFPKSNITKSDIASYYRKIATYMLPYISDRPLTLKRYPDGINKEGFYNKHAPDYFPKIIKRIAVPMHSKSGEIMNMVSAYDAEDLAYFVGQDTIEIHSSLSTANNLEKPDQIIFDLDPSDNDFEKVRIVALKLKILLDSLSLPAFVKTTGSRGVHVHVPIKPEKKFSDVKLYTKNIAEQLGNVLPTITTLKQRINKRGQKVFIDILRNDYGMTAISPYSLRAHEDAPIATPIDWNTLQKPSLRSQSYCLNNIFDYLQNNKDPWQEFSKKAVSLSLE